MLNLVDHFGGTFLVFILAIFELIGVFWIYGLDNFCDDVEFMINRRPGAYWRICWVFVTPIFMLIIFIYSMVTYERLLYGQDEYPTAAYGQFSNIEMIEFSTATFPIFLAAGWTLLGIGVILVPLWAIYIIEWKSPVGRNIKQASRPKDNWGPKSLALKNEWEKFKTDRKETRAAANKITNHGRLRRAMRSVFGF